MDALTVARNASVSIVFALVCYAMALYLSINAAFAFLTACACYLILDFRDAIEDLLSHIERMRTTQLLTIYDETNEGDEI